MQIYCYVQKKSAGTSLEIMCLQERLPCAEKHRLCNGYSFLRMSLQSVNDLIIMRGMWKGPL